MSSTDPTEIRPSAAADAAPTSEAADATPPAPTPREAGEGATAAGERPAAPEAGDGAARPGWSLRRVLRTPHGEGWEVLDGVGERVGAVSVQYGDRQVEGMLAISGTAGDDDRRAALAWITESLSLDTAAGAAGVIHWITVAGDVTDYWRRAPGRRSTGAEEDLAVVRARVESVLNAMQAEWGVLPDGDIAVDAGSVRVFVAVRLVDVAVAVRVFAITNLDVPISGDLPAFLLSLNFSLAVGRFSIDASRGAVWFDHVLAGEEIDESSLARVIGAVATTADRYDDEIKNRFGGRTFRESGSPVEEAAKLPSPGMPSSGMAGGYL